MGRPASPSISVVIPVYRDEDALSCTLAALEFGGVQVIVVATPGDSSLQAVRERYPELSWMEAPRGRARQMNAGAAVSSAEWLLFLHADTRLPSNWRDAIAAADRTPSASIGCFRFALDSASTFARAIEVGVRLRVALFALPYGDQALFVRRADFEAVGGYADVPIMEDVDLVRRLVRRGQLFRSSDAATTSARKWEQDGWIRRTLKHLRLITLYFLGVTPDRLVASI